MKNVVVISAHPDDEVLGVGGTLLKHKNNGDNIYWIITTNISVDQGFSEDKVDERQNEIEVVAEKLGVKKKFLLNYPTMSLSSSDTNEIIPKIASIFNEIKPEIIYTLNRSDAHSDHKYTFNSVIACTKSFRFPFIKQVLMYECISETEFAPSLHEKVFIPNYYVDISKYIDEKLEIMKVYESELGTHPFPRSLKNIKALATFRGTVAGVEFAESFQLIKFIDK